MKRNVAYGVTAILFLTLCILPASAQTTTNQEGMQRARARIQTLGVNRDQKVEVKLRDQTKVKGYITEVEQESFTVKDAKSGASQTIDYSEVAEARKAGGGISKTWLIVGGAAAGAVITWIIVKPAFCDGGAQTRGIC